MRAFAAALALVAAPVPTPIGAGPRYVLPAGPPLKGAACKQVAPAREQAHVELFANRLAMILPAGIGSGCSYVVRTRLPIGVVEFEPGATLGDLFSVWGQPLSRTRLASFHGEVSVFVGGRRRLGDPRTLRLAKHAEIVVEIGGYVRPHSFFLFVTGR